MSDIPRQGSPQSTVSLVNQGNTPDTIPGQSQIFSSAGGALQVVGPTGIVTTLGGGGGGSGTVTSVGLAGDGVVVATGPSAAVTTAGNVQVTLASTTGNTALASPVGGGAGTPTYRKLVAADILGTGSTSGQVLTSTGSGSTPTWQTVSGGGGSGTVTSVALQGDGTLLLTGPSAAVTTNGNLVASLANATGNTIFASPVNGTSGTPIYRKAINTDLVGTNSLSGQVLTSTGAGSTPNWSTPNAGTVTSVAFQGDGTVLSNTPSTAVTSSGNTTATLASAAQNTVLASPTGSSGTPSYRKIIAPDVVGTGGTSGQVLTNTGAGAAPTWQNPAAGGGTVTSVAFQGDGVILSSTPTTAVTASGNVLAIANNASQNVVLAGPASGGSGSPLYRSVIAADLIGTSGTSGQILTNTGAGTAPTWQNAPSNGITALTGGVTASGPGSAAATVVSVGGSTASDVNSATTKVLAASTSGYVLTATGVAGGASFQAPSGGGGTTKFNALQAGSYQRQQSGAYYMNVGIALSQDVFWIADASGTIINASGYVYGDVATGNVTFTVYKNGSTTVIATSTFAMSTTLTKWITTGGPVSFVANDQIALAVNPTSATPKVTCLGHVKVQQ